LFFFLSLILSLSGCPLFFILSFFFLVPSNLLYFFSSPLIAWYGGIYRGRGRESYPTPIQS
jgi:hypothetical protein